MSARHRASGHIPGWCAIVVALCCVSVPTGGQMTFRGSARMVPVYVTVRNSGGQLVFDLPRDAFQVRDNGRLVDLAAFSNEPQPLTAVVLTGVLAAWSSVTDGLTAFVNALEPPDRARIGTFGAELSLSPHLTGDKSLLSRIIREEVWLTDDYPDVRVQYAIEASGEPGPRGTRVEFRRADKIWPAVAAAMDSLATEQGRRVVIVVTNDKSELPSTVRSRVEDRAVADGFTLYAVGFEGLGQNGALIDVTERTGGGHVEVPDGAELQAVFRRVVDELRHQYLLGFVPVVLDGRRHRIDVAVTHRNLTVRARREYLAAP